jgi:predicted secreted protein
MTATAGSPPVSVPSPERLAVPETGPDRGTVPPAIARSRPGRELVRTAVSVAIVAAIFGFALPRFASYGSVLSSMSTMT